MHCVLRSFVKCSIVVVQFRIFPARLAMTKNTNFHTSDNYYQTVNMIMNN